MAKYANPYPHLSKPPTTEVRLWTDHLLKGPGGPPVWSAAVTVTLGTKVVTGTWAGRFLSLDQANTAAEAFVQDVLKTLLHGEAGA